MSKFAFVDETFRDPSSSVTAYYQLTALLVEDSEVSSLRAATVAIAPASGFHASVLANRGDELAVEKMLQHSAETGWHVVVVSAEHHGIGQEVARQRCLATLLEHVDQQKITRVVADSRLAIVGRDPQARNKYDLATLVALRRQQTVSRHLTLTHESGKNEQLLWLPDAVGWAFRQQELRGRQDFWDYVSGVTTVIRI